jgi:hypothetical protein
MPQSLASLAFLPTLAPSTGSAFSGDNGMSLLDRIQQPLTAGVEDHAHSLKLANVQGEQCFDGLPIVRATVEALSVRPRVRTLFYIPLAFDRADWFYACPCGFVSREHGSAVRASKEICTLCVDANMSRVRRRHYLARLAVERSA